MSSIAEKVVEYLRWHHSAKPSEIAGYLGVSVRLVRAVLARLRERGIVAKTDRGYVLKAAVDAVGVEPSREVIGSSAAGGMGYDELRLRITELSSRLSVIERRVGEVEGAVDELRATAGKAQISADPELVAALLDALDIVKMALQAIAMGDRESLDSALRDLEDATERLREKPVRKTR
ncbi:MAG: HTH domain-containing protein [Ignisphaera sp.]|nr:HTH domain-containing protein [Ignisphaera sp.]MDW8084728.1 HTH domain-containing protein [Ignisphaera sp.]